MREKRTRFRHSSFVIRSSGFTLVELLVAIGIIAILSGLLLGVAATAAESGRQARTKSMIARLHTLLMEHYDSYKDRRAPLSDSLESAIGQISNRRLQGPTRAEARLYALRELMILEMPDRWSDVLLAGISGNPSAVSPNLPLYLKTTSNSQYGGPTPLVEAYRRQYYAIASGVNKITGAANTADNILDNQGAECLYMVIMFATADGEARGLFNASSIGDVDGDGAPEFLDGWGRPINFLRWAPGYESDQQLNANAFADDTDWITQADADHDPFDLFKSDPFAFRLVPLIFSAGGDETYGIRTIKPSVTWKTVSGFNANLSNWGSQNRKTYIENQYRVTPYMKFSGEDDGVDAFYGTIRDDTATDNITNHNLSNQ